MNNFYITKNSKTFIQARRGIGFCNLSNLSKITVYGPNAIELINKFSIRDISKINNNAFMTIMMKHKKLISEVLIIKLTPLKYLIISEKDEGLYKLLKKSLRKYPLVTLDISTNEYSLFSLHGDKENEYFKTINSSTLYYVNHQGYRYHVILTSSVNKFSAIDHFKSLGFIEINHDIRNIFLNSNNVITNLNKVIKKYRLSIFALIYNADNLTYKVKKRPFCIKQYEGTQNFVVSPNMPIYNHKRRKIGYIHNFYRLANKKNPFILGIVKKDKTSKISLLKYNKKEIIAKEYNVH